LGEWHQRLTLLQHILLNVLPAGHRQLPRLFVCAIMGHQKELLSVWQRSCERIILLFLLLWQPPFRFCWSQCHQCPYSGITDAHIHALVGDGTHGHAEQIQTFRCQACHITFNARRHTPLYRLKTPSRQVAVVLTARASGLDPSAAERVFGYRQATITTWLSRAGEHAQTLHERSFCNLWLSPLQLDELRTRLRNYTQVLWLWLAIDPCSKLLPVLYLGPRTQNVAHRVIHSLRQLLAPGCLPLFTSDGLNLYFYALTAHFGQWLAVSCRGRKARQ